ncbi:PQQ-dependent sugar dehydrogenase [Agarivorans sp. 1_MG-2023]|uniref:PQQ-dependent sugar dehydrogenase n=1 Tax=Agarivorans sp. 1_MG-2023 TaxID=3062634 RepID=UPI0026E317EA|nr:PQQ-dependent sugar dehydrogenase [Agarivorans sp. 1_MG-2023]MDO6763084.1 PQQ-dependent sugar dehydrogenase [Agarivorans sp. 1_MG-2023]
MNKLITRHLNGVVLILLALVSVYSHQTSAEQTLHSSQDYSLQVDKLTQLPGVPWGMDWLNSTTLIVTLRRGELLSVDLNKAKLGQQAWQNIDGLPAIWAQGQGGLLDVVKGPDGYFYFTYSKPHNGSGVTTLAKAQIQQDESGQVRMSGWQDLFVSNSASSTNRHYGSRIAFDTQQHVYFSIGDRGVRDNGQNTLNHAATIARLKLDGSIPSNNPFVGNSQVDDAIYSYGHRNPQGLAFDHLGQRLWAIEHGPRGGDELNLIQAGANYGWPITSHGKEYWSPLKVGDAEEQEGINSPLKVYVPSIAPGSLIHYSGNAFPAWQGDLFSGALKLQHLNRIIINEQGIPVGEERLFEDLNERIRALAVDKNGYIYFSADSGNLYKVSPK